MRKVLICLPLLFALGRIALPQQQASGRIEGVILKLGTQEPLAKASVQLLGGAEMLSTTTEGDGRFYFPNLQPGAYRVLVRRDNYWPAEHGQRWVDGPGQPIVLAAGQQMTNVQIAMTPSGVISGRITNSIGEPLAGARVRAMKPWIQENQRMLRVVQEVVANDLGEYRLIWLLPGTYYVSATALNNPAAAVQLVINPDADGDAAASRTVARQVTSRPLNAYGLAEDEVFTPIYFPTTPDGLRALPVQLEAGTEYRGADITVSPTRAFHVRGVVTNPPQPAAQAARGGAVPPPPFGVAGRGARGLGVNLAPLTPNGSVYGTGSDASTGRFDFPRVVPGGYVAYLFIDGLTVRAPVDVRAGDVEEVRLTISEGVNIPVNLTFDGDAGAAKLPDLTGLRVTLWRDPTLINAPAMPANAGGSAVLQNIATGDYRVYVNPLFSPLQGNYPVGVPAVWQNFYVKSMRLGDQDILNGGLRFNRQPEAPLEIVLGGSPGAIQGRVLDERQQPVPSAFVTLFAADVSQRIYRTDMYKVVSTDVSGAFRAQGLPPGEYKVFAWGGVERGAWMDPNFVQQYERSGVQIRVEEGRIYSADVPLNTPR